MGEVVKLRTIRRAHPPLALNVGLLLAGVAVWGLVIGLAFLVRYAIAYFKPTG